MRGAGLALALVVLAGAEPLGPARFRAVTLEPGQRRSFRVERLEKVTAASGRCVEEGLDVDEPETFWLEASCSGVRTTLAWRRDGSRVAVLACAEDEKRAPALVKRRQKLQAELKALKGVTACVRNGTVELWGWALTPTEAGQVAALARRLGEEQVTNKVELLGDDER
ncbi:MAG: hypothetical protein INH41_05925 [Myxococcaceae bacterium]|nr:hypothetical protein [Myxococcaceae bacterium]MCA3011924.1 hypothetical protein [Myxococcaceae bacterium]